MKIVKFGTISYTPDNKPLPANFKVEFESAEEEKFYESDHRRFLPMLLAAIAKHMNIE